jgi:hypothetical protein
MISIVWGRRLIISVLVIIVIVVGRILIIIGGRGLVISVIVGMRDIRVK